MSKDIKKDVLNNELLKTLLESIEDKEEKEKTLKAIENMLQQIQDNFGKVSQVLEQANKK